MQRQVGEGADEEDESGGAVPAGGLAGAVGQQQVQLVLQGEHADHGEREGEEGPVAQDLAPVREDRSLARLDFPGGQHEGLRDGEDGEDPGRGQRGRAEVHEEQRAAQQRADQGAGGGEHVEQGERLRPAPVGLLRDVGAHGGVEQRPGEPAEDGRGEQHGQVVAEREQGEPDGAQGTAGDDDAARAEPVGGGTVSASCWTEKGLARKATLGMSIDLRSCSSA